MMSARRSTFRARASARTAPRARRRGTSARPASVTEPLESRTLLTAVTDDFNDGNDNNWTHYEPLAPFGAPGTYSVVDGAYRIQAAESPAPDQAGPGRAGSIRDNVERADFITSVDIVGWDDSLNQAFGLLGRVTTPGLGTTNGYALSYATNGDLDITLLTGELTDDLDPAVDVFLDSGKDYRLIFEGHGNTLTGRIVDLETGEIVAATRAIDSTYSTGQFGVFVYDNTRAGNATADATFDNFSVDDAPPDPTVAYWRFEEGGFDQEFQAPTEPGGAGSGLAADSFGGDDTLRTFADFTNPTYRGDVPADKIPVTGENNRKSLQFTPNEDLYSEGAPVNNHVFDQFTIETSVKFNNLDGWQTFLGKDGFQFANSDPNLSSLYFQLANDDAHQDHIAFKVHQADGTFKEVYTTDTVVADQWYNLVAVLSNDGTAGDPADQTLSLYLQNPDTGQYALQGQTDFRGGMANQDRTWTVGRGMFANNPTDWIDGFVDEVRISDAALSPNQFLFASGGESPNFHVTQVFVNGPGLTGQTSANGVAFRTLAGVDNTYGYGVPAGTNQLKSIPWNGGVNQIAIRFDLDVASSIGQDDLVVRGVNTPNYTITNFSYDPATKTGVWTLSAPITNDKVRLVLDDAGITGLDGEWQNGNAAETYPSGDGTVGGDFDFRVNVLRGDATQDGTVNALDLSFIKARLNKTATNPGTTGATYSPFADIVSDGTINAIDLSSARARLNNRLPTGEPAAATALLFGRKPISA